MNATEITTLSMTEIRAFCTANSISVTGDRRSKATYIKAIKSFQSEQTVTDIESLPAMPDPFKIEQSLVSNVPAQQLMAVELNSELLPVPKPQPPTPTIQRGASLVVLVIATMLSALFLLMGMGLRSLIPLIAAVVRLSVSIWRSTIDPQPVIQSIDRFPLPV